MEENEKLIIEHDFDPADLDSRYLAEDPEEAKNISHLSSMYREVYDEIEVRDLYVRKLKKTKAYLAEKLYDAITASGLEKVYTSEGSFRAELKEQISIKKEKEEEAFSFLEEKGLGDCIKRTVHFQTLNKLYRDKSLGDSPNAEIFAIWQTKQVSIRRS